MLIKIKRKHDVVENDVTDEFVYRQRREFIKASTVVAVGTFTSGLIGSSVTNASVDFSNIIKSKHSVNQKQTSFEAITTYNNFYELDTFKWWCFVTKSKTPITR